MKQVGEHGVVSASRRRLICALVAAFATCCTPPALAKQLMVPPEGELDAFIRLSAVVTGVVQLDRATARKILDSISVEPWGKEHLAQISAKLLPQMPDGSQQLTRQQLMDPQRFTEGERWFIGHLLTTWFTGVYYHQIGNRVVAYRDALMHVALQDVRPIPGHCEGVFGFWSEPPQVLSK